MRDERDEIRARVDLVELVGQKVLLKRAGKHWKGLCPFHDDRNPSFFVSADTGRYKCWSCGEGGDAFTWVMKTQNVEFVEALKILALMAGITLSGYKSDKDSGRTQNLAMMRAAQTFFVESLAKATHALNYCEQRGIDSETIERWGIGFSPSDDHGLASRLRKDKFALAEAKELFLVENDGSGAFFDKFRGRLMFPIHDERGELVAFGGRALGDMQPKYINSSDTPLYRKSRVLYGLDKAKDSIAKSRRAVLVEGYLDVIACHRSGVTTAIASLGTSLAEDHAKLLRRWCEEILILYDADAAGEKAAGRACEVLQAEGLTVRIALLPKGADPDTMLREAGPAAVQAAVEKGLTPTEFRILQLEKTIDPQSEEFWSEVVLALANTTSLAEAEKHFGYLKAKYMQGRGSAEEQLRSRVRDAQRAKLRQTQRKAAPTETGFVADRCHPAEAVVLRAFLEDDLRHLAYQSLKEDLFRSEKAKLASTELLTRFPDAPPVGKPVEWLHEIENAEVVEFLNAILVVSPYEADLINERQFDGTVGAKRQPPVSSVEFGESVMFLKNEDEVRRFNAEKSEESDDPLGPLRAKHDREAYRWE